MNLLYGLESFPMAQPKVRYSKEGKKRLKGLVVGDSYYWGLQYIYFGHNIFEDGHFWFYNREVFPPINGKSQVHDLDFIKEVLKKEVILLIATEATINGFAWGFIQKLYEELVINDYPIEDIVYESKTEIEVIDEDKSSSITKIVTKIRSNEDWLSLVRAKAKSKQISLDSMLVLEAEFLLK